MTKSTPSAPLAIHLNDELCHVPEHSSLLSLIRRMAIADQSAIAVALNGVFVRRADWGSLELTSDDRVMLIQPGSA